MPLSTTLPVTRFALELEGKSAGLVTSAQIGAIRAVTSTVTVGPEAKTAFGPVTYGDTTIVTPISEGAQLDWIASFWRKEVAEKSGAVILADMNFKERRRATFGGATINEVKLDDLDARDNKSAYSVSYTFAAERLRYETSSGTAVSGVPPTKMKAWSPANFRIKMGGLPCNRVVKVSGLTTTARFAEETAGSFRLPTRHLAAVAFGDVTLEISADDATFGEWNKFAQKVLQDGVISEEEELTGVIEWLDPTLKNVLGTLTLHGCSLKEFTFPKASDDAAAKFTAVFAVEQYGKEGLVVNR